MMVLNVWGRIEGRVANSDCYSLVLVARGFKNRSREVSMDISSNGSVLNRRAQPRDKRMYLQNGVGGIVLARGW